MSIERARADLDHLAKKGDDLRAELANVEAEAARIRIYLEYVERYRDEDPSASQLLAAAEHDDGNLLEPESSLTSSQGGRPRGGGISEMAVNAAVEYIRLTQTAQHARDLVEVLEQKGIHIKGANQVSNLSGYLSRSYQLKNDRAFGWSLAEWPDHHAP
jgi:hypothetical protein